MFHVFYVPGRGLFRQTEDASDLEENTYIVEGNNGFLHSDDNEDEILSLLNEDEDYYINEHELMQRCTASNFNIYSKICVKDLL